MSEPARRFVLAQSWWVASEIARRHPELLVIETHPFGGQYDCLDLIDPRGPTTAVRLNRPGSLHAAGAVATWDDVLGSDDAHDAIRRLEASAGLAPPSSTPATSVRTVTYRVLARVLTSVVDDRYAWDARNGRVDSDEGDPLDRPELAAFPTVVSALRNLRPNDLLGQPAYRFWLLLRGADAVAVLDTDGLLHQRDRDPLALMPIYRASGRRLTATVGAALGHLLP